MLDDRDQPRRVFPALQWAHQFTFQPCDCTQHDPSFIKTTIQFDIDIDSLLLTFLLRLPGIKQYRFQVRRGQVCQ
jgi:hypothetical protein